jgi:hypothetical protein
VQTASGGAGDPDAPLTSPDWIARTFSPPRVLILNEFAQLGMTSTDVVDAILHGLCAMLTADPVHRALLSLVVAGPYKILELHTTPVEGLSPWNITYPHRMPGFTFEDVRGLFDKFTSAFPADESCRVTGDVIYAILTVTGGHRGWTMLAGEVISENLKALRNAGKAVVTTAEWDGSLRAAFHHALSSKFVHINDWVNGEARHVALQVPTMLDQVTQLAATCTPIRLNEEEWATGRDAWLGTLARLAMFGAVEFTEERTFVPALSPVARDAVLGAVDSLLAVSEPCSRTFWLHPPRTFCVLQFGRLRTSWHRASLQHTGSRK